MREKVGYQSKRYAPVSLKKIIERYFKKEQFFDNEKALEDILFLISTDVLHVVNMIFHYTVDHLSSRETGGILLSKIPLVIDEMLEISALYYVASVSNDSNVIFKLSQNILKKLIYLGGARSLLSHNALSFLVDITLFLKAKEVDHDC